MGSTSSAYRVIYLDVDGRIQKVVFSRFCSPYDIKELFCTALGIPRESVPALSVLDRNTTLSLLDSTGAMVSIDPTMPHNTERSPYSMVPLTGGQLADHFTQFLEAENVPVPPWPAYSSDISYPLSTFGILWIDVCDSVFQYPPISSNFAQSFEEEWDNVPQATINSLINSM